MNFAFMRTILERQKIRHFREQLVIEERRAVASVEESMYTIEGPAA
jgi:hypothetical protein